MILDILYKKYSLDDKKEFDEIAEELSSLLQKIENLNVDLLKREIVNLSEDKKWQEKHSRILQEIQEET